MNFNEQITNVALLGTAHRQLAATDFPKELQECAHDILTKSEDAETAFYQLAALSFAFERAGMETCLSNSMTVMEAPEEEKTYFSREVGELMLSLHVNKHPYLLLYAYRKAAGCGRLLPPQCLPTLLAKAFDRTNPRRHEEQRWLAGIAGHRGRWLLPQMGLPAWEEVGNEQWETASHEERKRMLCRWRKVQPEQGLALLQTELKNESAVHREELIRCLRAGLSKKDEAFLQEIAATDRGRGVRQAALQLLGSIPDSEFVNACQDWLRGKLHYNFLMGWSYDKIEYTPKMKLLGLEEVSSCKTEKDDRFLLRQLAERVPLTFWCEFYNCTPEKAAGKLAKNPPFQKLFDITRPILNFQDAAWAYYTLKENADESVSRLAGLLSVAQREEIAFHATGHENSFPEEWLNEDEEWGMKFSTYVLQRLRLFQHGYYYTKETAERLVLHFPFKLRSVLEQTKASAEERKDGVTVRFVHQLLEYMDIKQRIDTLLNNEQ